MRCLALDIGGTKIAAAIVENQQVSNRKQVATPSVSGDAQQIAMHQVLGELVQSYADQFDYIAVASTGIIRQGVLTALNPKNLGGLAQFPLKESLARHTDKPIGLLNDAQAATVAEYQGQAVPNFIFITVSTGVGGGIILDGKLLTEPNGIAGHIGHTLADPNGAVCGCGRVGCVEAVAAGRAIEAVSKTWDPPCTPKEVFTLFAEKDEKATALVHRSAKAIANLIADMVISLDVQKVALGGSVGLANGYLQQVQQFLAAMPAPYQADVVAAQYGADAGLVGAAQWAKQQLNSFLL